MASVAKIVGKMRESATNVSYGPGQGVRAPILVTPAKEAQATPCSAPRGKATQVLDAIDQLNAPGKETP
ncbi:hypothetical protein BH09ACT7_BH09ACT7_23190 [soil metagenome]